MKIAVPKERRTAETRVAASPETVKKLIGLGFTVTVEKGAGAGASFTDQAYEEAGATLAAKALAGADLVLKVAKPTNEEIAELKKGAVLISLLDPFRSAHEVKALADQGVTAFAMELVPRITRAQSMDVLSSQANLAGYKAVLDAADHFNRAFPMMMTAAGKITPANVLIMGAGVAGLQAIATAKRLGAIVHATDVRPAAKEQVASLGGKFLAVEDAEFKAAETATGYAKPMSPEYQKKQAALIAETLPKIDIVITTALIPGRPAPRLISADMVKSMKPGSVIVDLAVETGGNVEGSEAGKVVTKNGVSIIGHLNVPGRLAADASALYARNLLNFIMPGYDKETGKHAFDFEDEIIKASCVTRDGKVVHADVAKAHGWAGSADQQAPKPEPAPEATPEATPEPGVEAPDDLTPAQSDQKKDPA